MNPHILIVSHRKDYDWFWYSIRSLRKFCTHPGLSATVVVPKPDVEHFMPFCDQMGVIVQGFDQDPQKPFLAHEVVVCEADRWAAAGTDLVIHLDSDHFFTGYFNMGLWVTDGLPHLHIERYSDFRERHPNRYSWKACVDDAIGGDNEWETMVRPSNAYWANTYERLRAHIANRHQMPFREYVLSKKEDYPQGFAEFPTLGAFALATDPGRYQHIVTLGPTGPIRTDLIDCTMWRISKNGAFYYEKRPTPYPIIAFWSHGGLDGPTDRASGGTPRQIMDKILAS